MLAYCERVGCRDTRLRRLFAAGLRQSSIPACCTVDSARVAAAITASDTEPAISLFTLCAQLLDACELYSRPAPQAMGAGPASSSVQQTTQLATQQRCLSSLSASCSHSGPAYASWRTARVTSRIGLPAAQQDHTRVRAVAGSAGSTRRLHVASVAEHAQPQTAHTVHPSAAGHHAGQLVFCGAPVTDRQDLPAAVHQYMMLQEWPQQQLAPAKPIQPSHPRRRRNRRGQRAATTVPEQPQPAALCLQSNATTPVVDCAMLAAGRTRTQGAAAQPCEPLERPHSSSVLSELLLSKHRAELARQVVEQAKTRARLSSMAELTDEQAAVLEQLAYVPDPAEFDVQQQNEFVWSSVSSSRVAQPLTLVDSYGRAFNVTPLWIAVHQPDSGGTAQLYESLFPLHVELVDLLSCQLQPLCSVAGMSFEECDTRHGFWRNYFVGLSIEIPSCEDDVLWPNQVYHRDRVQYNLRHAGDLARFLADPVKVDIETHLTHLRRMQEDRGYKRGWCWHLLRSRWGEGTLKALSVSC